MSADLPPKRSIVKAQKQARTPRSPPQTLSVVPPLHTFKLPYHESWVRKYAMKGYAGLTVDDRARLSHLFNVLDADLSEAYLNRQFVSRMVFLGFNKDAIKEFAERPETRLSLSNLDSDYEFALKAAESKYAIDVGRVPFNRMTHAVDVLRDEDPNAPLHIRKDIFLMFYYLGLMADESWPPLVQQFKCHQWPFAERPKNDILQTRTAFCIAMVNQYCEERDYVHRPRRGQVRKEIDAALVLAEPWIVRARHTARMPDPLGAKNMHSHILVDVWKRSWLIKHNLWRGLPLEGASTPPDTFDWYRIPVALGGKIVKFPELRQA